jgi:RNA-binding protein
MNMVGRAVSTFGKRMLIIRCDPAQIPGLYSGILDSRMQPVGTIVDLFGNVKAPYAAVFCKGQCRIRPDEKLYAKAPAQPGRARSVYRKRA